MTYREEYNRWLSSGKLSSEETRELLSIAGDEKKIESRFYAPLEFGTAGLRGILGIGLNRMNVYTVRRTTQGFASLICSLGAETMARGCAIAYDCRNMSTEFAGEAASVLAANGIKVYLFDEMRPTPELSFAVRRLRCIAGINITASHNTKEYNGYKAYWEDGAQLPPDKADIVSKSIAETDIFTGIKTMNLDKAVSSGLVEYIGREMDEEFLSYSLSLSVGSDAVKAVADDFRIVYTPFHGTGYRLVPELLRRLGVKHLILDPRQSIPDGNFPTVVSPNPQDKEGFAGSIKLAKENDVDLIIGTDPDADRVGIVLRAKNGEYVTLSGNQVGVLLLDYLINAMREKGTLPENAALVKTIVTTQMARVVAEANGVHCADTFTGFKFLAEQIGKFEEDNSYKFILAFEESYGYLVGDGARDKDAVTASMLIAEMAAWHMLRGNTLYDAMELLYEKYGYFIDETINIMMPGIDGLERMADLLSLLRKDPPTVIGGIKVLRLRDYLTGKLYDFCPENDGIADGKTDIKGSDVLYFEMSDGAAFIIRPSGTEPKIRVYILLRGASRKECEEKLEVYKKAASEIIK
ncbi:MAG: phospho-sugar mutase [Clostridiales bacterium]|jgi:phosphoglucomutase|nr:phospho-sugar mutase [Clostridiales bacterium]